MISGIHLATALSVMLHMEQEGNGMDTKELIEKLNAGTSLEFLRDDGSYDTETEALMAKGAKRLAEQQQVIDALASRLEFISTALTDHGYSDYGPMKEAVTSALSLAKGQTKDGE